MLPKPARVGEPAPTIEIVVLLLPPSVEVMVPLFVQVLVPGMLKVIVLLLESVVLVFTVALPV